MKAHPKLSVFFTAGFPKLEDTAIVLNALEAAEVRTIEIGFPFSDPMADGPTIQNSGNVSIQNGMNLALLFEQLAQLPASKNSSRYLMGYLNPVLQYGVKEFFKSAAQAGVSGYIVPDLPLRDYRNDFKPLSQAHNVRPVFLITDRTSNERIVEYDNEDPAFLYVVAVEGVTGNTQAKADRLREVFKKLRGLKLKSELVAGFGISTASVFSEMSSITDRAIVGSEFVRRLANVPAESDTRSNEKALKEVIEKFVREFSSGVDE